MRHLIADFDAGPKSAWRKRGGGECRASRGFREARFWPINKLDIHKAFSLRIRLGAAFVACLRPDARGCFFGLPKNLLTMICQPQRQEGSVSSTAVSQHRAAVYWVLVG